MVLATGPDQGAYAEFGKRYAADAEGATASTVRAARRRRARPRTCALLRDPSSSVDIAFVQGGADADRRPRRRRRRADDGLVSLGSLFYEPVWLFYRDDVGASGC